MRTTVKLLLLPALGALGAGIALAAGIVDFSAMKPPSHVEETLATFALNRSIAHHASKEANPLGGEPAAVAAGLALFRTHCASCHGAPGIDPTEGGASLNPPAPGLTLPRVQARSDGELKWIVSNGIRMTGMPAFGASRSEQEVWQLVAALRRLPQLSAQERRMLAQASGASAVGEVARGERQ
jgi:mono/diheme cytochrome c family protein